MVVQKLKNKLNEIKVEVTLLKIYVDDVNGSFGVVEKGFDYVDGKLAFSTEKEEEDKELPDDMVTMKVVQKVANEIDSMIVMTIDVPSNHKSKKVPMLDIQVWINNDDENKIYYSFFEKETKSPFVMYKSSAMPMRKKFECLGQEVFRRLHNTKQEEMISIMNKFMLELKMSGYNAFDRFQIIQSGYKNHDKGKLLRPDHIARREERQLEV